MTRDVVLTAGLFAVLAAIALCDARTRRIPDRLSVPLAAAGLGLAAAGGSAPFGAAALGAVAGYGSLAAFGALWFRWRGEDGLGLGDAKLFAAAGAWLGWAVLPELLLVAVLGGLAFAVARGDTRAPLPFGPFLAASFAGFWLHGLLAGP